MSVLIKDINTQELLGDPGYNGENIYRILRKNGIKPTIRLPNHLSSKKAKTKRQQNVACQQTKPKLVQNKIKRQAAQGPQGI